MPATAMQSLLYYEVHVTIEPVFDDQLDEVKRIAQSNKFKVADLLMQKRKTDKAERSKYDTFLTTRCQEYMEAVDRVRDVVDELKHAGYKVWRYKIEDTILDSQIEDVLELCDSKQ